MSQDDLNDIFAQLRAAGQAMRESMDDPQGFTEDPQDPAPSKVSVSDYFEALKVAISNMSEEDIKKLGISTNIIVFSMISRRMMRKALEAAGVESSAAKKISKGVLWASWAIAANATLGNEYSSWLARERLYSEES
jgi:hypothetical protein